VLRYEYRLSRRNKIRYRTGMFQQKNRDPDKQAPQRDDVEWFLIKVSSFQQTASEKTVRMEFRVSGLGFRV